MAMLPAPVEAGKSRQGPRRARNVVHFGPDVPQRPGDYGIERVNGMAWLVRALEADETHQAQARRGRRGRDPSSSA